MVRNPIGIVDYFLRKILLFSMIMNKIYIGFKIIKDKTRGLDKIKIFLCEATGVNNPSL
jgi:hypothetical protein